MVAVPVSRSTAGLGAWLGVFGVTVTAVGLVGVGLDDLLRNGGLAYAVRSAWMVAVGPAVLGAFAVLLVMERLWPDTPGRTLSRAHVTDFGWLALTAAVTIPLLTVAAAGMG